MKNIRIILSVLVVLLLSATELCAKEVTILYSGNTHAMLYTCSCPVERDGGIARRATLVKQMRRKYPNLLLLDCGAFTAGGLMDEYIQNTALDMQRSALNLKAMEMMRYDAVAVSSDEFNFGKDFFLKNAGKRNPVFLSLNLESDKVEPYIIKEVSGVKIGIIGLTGLSAGQKAEGLKVSPPKDLDKLIKRLRGEGVEVVVVLSTLGKKDDLDLVSRVEGIDVLFMGYYAPGKDDTGDKLGSTFIVHPSWQGRKMGKLTLEVKDGKLLNCKNEDIRLSDKIPDDPGILAILPRCYSNANCRKDSLIGACQNPGRPDAKCLFTEPSKLRLIVITAKDCLVCNTEPVVELLKKQFPGIEPEYIDLARAKKLVESLSIDTLPAYVLGGEAGKEANFNFFKDNLDPRGEMYVLKPQISGVSYFIGRKHKDSLDLFFSIFDKDTAGLLSVMREFNPKLHFLAAEKGSNFDAKNGPPEVEEYLRGVCVQKYYPDKFWDYLSCRAKNISSSWWDDCLQGADTEKIKTCARGPEGAQLLKENVALNKEVQISFGPTYLLDNYQIFSSRGVPSREDLKKVIRK